MQQNAIENIAQTGGQNGWQKSFVDYRFLHSHGESKGFSRPFPEFQAALLLYVLRKVKEDDKIDAQGKQLWWLQVTFRTS